MASIVLLLALAACSLSNLASSAAVVEEQTPSSAAVENKVNDALTSTTAVSAETARCTTQLAIRLSMIPAQSRLFWKVAQSLFTISSKATWVGSMGGGEGHRVRP
jgi:hypothetical protein